MKKILISVILGLLAGLVASTAHAGCFSEGMRVGTIQKISSKGIVNKSWEGELVQSGYRTRSGSGLLNVWRFSVLRPDVAKKLDDAAMTGDEVAVKYCQSALHNPLTQSTDYEITDVVLRKQ